MDYRKLEKLRRELRQLRRNATGHRADEVEKLARKVGRREDKRGKEPTWTRELDPHLSPPLSIPHHSADMSPGTFRSIVDQLLDDLDAWEAHLMETTDDHDSDDEDDAD